MLTNEATKLYANHRGRIQQLPCTFTRIGHILSSHLRLDGEEEGSLCTGDGLIDQQQLVRLQGVVLRVVPTNSTTP